MYYERRGNKNQLFNKHVRKFPTSFHKILTLTAIFNHLCHFFTEVSKLKDIKGKKKKKTGM